MTMIIKNKNRFFWTNLQKNLLLLVFVLQLGACSRKQTFTTDSFKTNTGWGYAITYKNKTIIKQSIIPVINDTKSFDSEKDALKVANLVVEKLSQNTSPTVTKNDLILLKIKL